MPRTQSWSPSKTMGGRGAALCVREPRRKRWILRFKKFGFDALASWSATSDRKGGFLTWGHRKVKLRSRYRLGLSRARLCARQLSSTPPASPPGWNLSTLRSPPVCARSLGNSPCRRPTGRRRYRERPVVRARNYHSDPQARSPKSYYQCGWRVTWSTERHRSPLTSIRFV